MSAHHLEALRLVPERVERASRFRTSYADLCMREVAELRERPKGTSHSAMDGDSSRMGWGLLAEAASGYFEAGQWAMLIDPPTALALWQRAGEVYRRLDFGFGYYLHAIIKGPQSLASIDNAEDARIADRMWDSLRAVMVASHTVDEDLRSPESVQLPEPLRHAQQQTYLILAGAAVVGTATGDQVFMGVSRRTLYSMVVRSPHYGGVTPVGALGVPINVLWQLAATIMQPKTDGLEQAVAIIGGLARRYDDTIQQAMANDHLWRNAAAPVDVGSFDIASIIMIAYQVFGADRLEENLDRVIRDLPITGRGQIDMALELAHASGQERSQS